MVVPSLPAPGVYEWPPDDVNLIGLVVGRREIGTMVRMHSILLDNGAVVWKVAEAGEVFERCSEYRVNEDASLARVGTSHMQTWRENHLRYYMCLQPPATIAGEEPIQRRFEDRKNAYMSSWLICDNVHQYKGCISMRILQPSQGDSVYLLLTQSAYYQMTHAFLPGRDRYNERIRIHVSGIVRQYSEDFYLYNDPIQIASDLV